jgi:hypothetical protein
MNFEELIFPPIEKEDKNPLPTIPDRSKLLPLLATTSIPTNESVATVISTPSALGISEKPSCLSTPREITAA